MLQVHIYHTWMLVCSWKKKISQCEARPSAWPHEVYCRHSRLLLQTAEAQGSNSVCTHPAHSALRWRGGHDKRAKSQHKQHTQISKSQHMKVALKVKHLKSKISPLKYSTITTLLLFMFWCLGSQGMYDLLFDQGVNPHPMHWKAKSSVLTAREVPATFYKPNKTNTWLKYGDTHTQTYSDILHKHRCKIHYNKRSAHIKPTIY